MRTVSHLPGKPSRHQSSPALPSSHPRNLRGASDWAQGGLSGKLMQTRPRSRASLQRTAASTAPDQEQRDSASSMLGRASAPAAGLDAADGDERRPLLPDYGLEMEAGRGQAAAAAAASPPPDLHPGAGGSGRSGKGRPVHPPLRIAGLELHPELVAIALIYATQGLLGLSRLGVFFFLKSDLGLDPASVGLITSLSYAPWMVKPIYGFLSDTLPLGGYRRRSYLLLCGFAGALAWSAMACAVTTPAAAVAALLLSSAATACSDVVADSVVVEMSRGEAQGTAGRLQSLCWASASAGSVVSAYFSGSLVESYGAKPVFWATAGVALLVVAAAAAIPEQRVRSGGGDSLAKALRPQAKALWSAVKQRSILLPSVFVFAWQATPTADTAMMFFETNELGFTTEFLGRIRLVSAVASLIGVGIFNQWLREVRPRKMFFWTAMIGAGLGLTQLILITGLNKQWGLSNELFALGDSALLTVLGQVSFMPVLVLAARLCPEGVEATLFATLMSVLNAGSFSGSALGSVMTGWFGVSSSNFSNLAWLSATCTLSSLLPLPLLGLLPKEESGRDKKKG